MVFDFGSRPPEVNSALIYSGAGAGPLSVASSAFANLSSELSSNATSYESVISQLGSKSQGPSPKAMASAAAYQTAYSSSVPPAAILANRTQLAQLVPKNILGQYTAAIAALE